MLDLEIVPERSLGCDTWEFVLGKNRVCLFLTSRICALFLRDVSYAILCYSCLNIISNLVFTWCIIYTRATLAQHWFFSIKVSRAAFVSYASRLMFIFFIAILDREINRLRCLRICFEMSCHIQNKWKSIFIFNLYLKNLRRLCKFSIFYI